ncbi:MAG: hypothetical protein KAJ39_07455 [Gammaproteobacteria bacterium]|nr:hypothetical protein [Gammaproteobacteria bacterium]
MTTTKKMGLIALLASMSWGAQAANFDYNYGQIGYETGDFTGLTLTGSFEIDKDIFVIARYAALTNDDLGVDLDYDDISIGAGYHMPIDAKTDAVFTVSFDSAEANFVIPFFGNVTADDTGILLTAGVRHNLNAKVELAAGIYHVTTFDGDTGIQAEARYNINNKMSAGLGFTSGDYLDGLNLNFRMGF